MASRPSATFPEISIEGAPRERGVQYGQLARERIHDSLTIYLKSWMDAGLADRDTVRARARDFAVTIRERFPDMLDEMQGIAEGSGCTLEDIVALNARTELLYGTNVAGNQAHGAGDEGCTGAVMLPGFGLASRGESPAGGHTIIGQNWDWKGECHRTAIMLRVRPDRGPEFLTFVEAGLLARSGINAAGIGLCGNFLNSDQDFQTSGVPIPTIRRAILCSETLAEAVGHVLRAPRAFSSNHLLAHRDGEAIDLEASPREVFTLFPEDGLITHANHFKGHGGRVRDTGVLRFPDSLLRDRRVEAKLRAAAKIGGGNTPPGVDDLKEALRDHVGYPDSVCRHPGGRAAASPIETVASVVMDLTDGVFWIARGPVCENEFHAFSLNSRDESGQASVLNFKQHG